MGIKIANTMAVTVTAKQCIEWPQDRKLFDPNSPFLICGDASNLLFVDPFFNGQLVRSNNQKFNIEQTNEVYRITLGAALNWHQTVKKLTEFGVAGIQNLAFIPGTVGAAPVQNIGAYGVEIADFISTVTIIDLNNQQKRLLSGRECQFGYRDSVFKRAIARYWLIDEICLKIPLNSPLKTHYGPLQSLQIDSPQTLFEQVCKIRKQKLPDPELIGNAGSFFKNPIITVSELKKLQEQLPDIPVFNSELGIKIPAAYLIDRAGLKGFQLNQARVHPQQPLVLTNLGQANGQNIAALAALVRQHVFTKYQVKLEPEVRFISTDGEIDGAGYLDNISQNNN
ncbi:UDP-N-acetylmuramate dehydrogenase [Gayadomonas joobiniege]|uniref:UDP-N-acetylmuramate dehydrogenase n=1 Tax=Gayadomonas joobiniege TaxID=1234606 RepID=UPI000363D7D3|nr:UDP-N-acetylmuramate dehydrogenase [Gayadomonas joobiniege]